MSNSIYLDSIKGLTPKADKINLIKKTKNFLTELSIKITDAVTSTFNKSYNYLKNLKSDKFGKYFFYNIKSEHGTHLFYSDAGPSLRTETPA